MALVMRWIGRLAFGYGPIVVVFATLAGAYGLEVAQASREAELHRLCEGVRLEAFLALGFSKARGDALVATIDRLEGVDGVEYIGQESAREAFVALFGEGLLDPRAPNPLPPSVVVRPELSWVTSERVALLATQLSELEGVEAVDYPAAWLATVDAEARWSSRTLRGAWVGAALALVMATTLVVWRRTARRATGLRTLRMAGVPLWWCGLGALAGALGSAIVAAALFLGLRIGLVEPFLAAVWPGVVFPDGAAGASLYAFGAGGVLTLTWVALVRAYRSAP